VAEEPSATAVGAMTERTAALSQRESSRRVSQPPAAGTNGATPARRHPLLGAFPLTVMTLATFLVVFAMMMARLTAGADPAVKGATTAALVEPAAAGSAVRTRASATAGAAATPTVAPARGSSAPAPAPAVVTRSSGRAGAGAVTDD
jgi:hypothetical protein